MLFARACVRVCLCVCPYVLPWSCKPSFLVVAGPGGRAVRGAHTRRSATRVGISPRHLPPHYTVNKKGRGLSACESRSLHIERSAGLCRALPGSALRPSSLPSTLAPLAAFRSHPLAAPAALPVQHTENWPGLFFHLSKRLSAWGASARSARSCGPQSCRTRRASVVLSAVRTVRAVP